MRLNVPQDPAPLRDLQRGARLGDDGAFADRGAEGEGLGQRLRPADAEAVRPRLIARGIAAAVHIAARPGPASPAAASPDCRRRIAARPDRVDEAQARLITRRPDQTERLPRQGIERCGHRVPPHRGQRREPCAKTFTRIPDRLQMDGHRLTIASEPGRCRGEGGIRRQGDRAARRAEIIAEERRIDRVHSSPSVRWPATRAISTDPLRRVAGRTSTPPAKVASPLMSSRSAVPAAKSAPTMIRLPERPS